MQIIIWSQRYQMWYVWREKSLHINVSANFNWNAFCHTSTYLIIYFAWGLSFCICTLQVKKQQLWQGEITYLQDVGWVSE